MGVMKGGGGERVEKLKYSRMKLWMIRATTSVLLWTCVVQLTAVGETWGPRVLKGWPSCFTHQDSSFSVIEDKVLSVPARVLPPKRVYKNNGYLMVSCNGGLNQMRAAICDMVTIARYLNVTLIVPELDKTSFWADPRYEMDMLAFSGCTQGCNNEEVEELTRMRYAYPWWKEKIINSDLKRKDGLCPLTPEETALILRALDIENSYQIYIAAGEIYGGNRRMASLASAYPKLVRKETLLEPSDLGFFQNPSSQMAALDYLVSLESDIFIPTYDGNMAKVVEGHRRFLGYKQTILLDRRLLVDLIDQYNSGSLSWNEFSNAVKESHKYRKGQPTQRSVIPDLPKEEDYFYANPEECLKPSSYGQVSSM
ncbi:hypothetical protein V6Z12_D07G066500 [Gossypium hirsutum]